MLFAKTKDIQKRIQFSKCELKKILSKFLFINTLNNKNLSLINKKRVLFFLVKNINKKESKVKLVRRCILTNRSRVSHRILGVSRIKLKEMLKFGVVPGCQKAVW
jgi:ribosomal protein S14